MLPCRASILLAPMANSISSVAFSAPASESLSDTGEMVVYTRQGNGSHTARCHFCFSQVVHFLLARSTEGDPSRYQDTCSFPITAFPSLIISPQFNTLTALCPYHLNPEPLFLQSFFCGTYPW